MKWTNIWEEMDARCFVHMIMSERGPGKTFSGLSGLNGLIDIPEAFRRDGRYILLRRTEVDCKSIVGDDSVLNPFKSINLKYNSDYTIQKLSDKIWGVYDSHEKELRELKGYVTALSSVGTVSSLDFPDVDYILYDEFIRKPSVRAIADESGLLWGLYESVNRNREFEGKPPVQLIMLSNSLNIYNEYMASLHVINELERLVRKTGYGTFQDLYRGLEILLLKVSDEFRAAKSQTAIARLTEGTAYGKMAYRNEFAYNDFSLIKRCNIKGMHPIIAIDNIYLWGDNNRYYATYAKGDCLRCYNSQNKHDRIAIRRDYHYDFLKWFAAGVINFETYDIKHTIVEIMLEVTV